MRSAIGLMIGQRAYQKKVVQSKEGVKGGDDEGAKPPGSKQASEREREESERRLDVKGKTDSRNREGQVVCPSYHLVPRGGSEGGETDVSGKLPETRRSIVSETARMNLQTTLLPPQFFRPSLVTLDLALSGTLWMRLFASS